MQDIKKKFWLEKFDCFSITGKDARKFLNGITTSNILNSENKVIKTCWLTPNGVLRALIEIIILERELEVIILAGNCLRGCGYNCWFSNKSYKKVTRK